MITSQLDNIFNKTYFEPTLTSFKNAIIINYKKVGTRWMGLISSLPNDFLNDKLQLDLFIRTESIGNSDLFPEFYNRICERNKLNMELGNAYIHTFFDIQELNKLIGESPKDNERGFNRFNTTLDFLKYEGVSSWNELFFENPHKDIVFLIRNPLERYISGCIQVLYESIDKISNTKEIQNELKFYVNMTDSELENLYKFIKTPSELDFVAVKKILKYIIDKRTDLIFQDVHTQNYLKNYIDFIHYIKDKNKIKIIDLSQCSNQNALKFFDKLRGDSEVSTSANTLLKLKESNKPIYQFFIDEYVNTENFVNSSSRFFIESEYNMYIQLLNSPYFVDLGD